MNVKDRYSGASRSQVSHVLKRSALNFSQNLQNSFVSPIRGKQKFIFVCGCGHSGTTLLAARLGQNPDALLIGRETGCFMPPSGLFAAKRRVEEWQYFAEIQEMRYIVEKTPKHVQCIGKIKQLLPESSVVVMVRNPLDNIASLYKRFGHLDNAIKRWRWDNEAVLKWSETGVLDVVRYEELTSDPVSQLKALSARIGMDWSEEIGLASPGSYGAVEPRGNMATRVDQISKEITQNKNGWEKVFSREEADYVLGHCAPLAARLGYAQK